MPRAANTPVNPASASAAMTLQRAGSMRAMEARPSRPIANVLQDMIVNGDNLPPLPDIFDPNNRRRVKERQWINKFFPVSETAEKFVKYTEELNDKHMEFTLIDLMNNQRVELRANEVKSLYEALKNLLGENDVKRT